MCQFIVIVIILHATLKATQAIFITIASHTLLNSEIILLYIKECSLMIVL